MSKPLKMDDISIIAQKEYLTAHETALLYNLGIHFVRELMEKQDCDFTIAVGKNHKRKLIHRKMFGEYLRTHCNCA